MKKKILFAWIIVGIELILIILQMKTFAQNEALFATINKEATMALTFRQFYLKSILCIIAVYGGLALDIAGMVRLIMKKMYGLLPLSLAGLGLMVGGYSVIGWRDVYKGGFPDSLVVHVLGWVIGYLAILAIVLAFFLKPEEKEERLLKVDEGKKQEETEDYTLEELLGKVESYSVASPKQSQSPSEQQ